MKAKYNSIQPTAGTSSEYDSQSDCCGAQNNSSDDAPDDPAATDNDHLNPIEFRRWCGIRRSTCLLSIYVCSYIGK